MKLEIKKWIDNPVKPSLWELIFGNYKWSLEVTDIILNDDDLERMAILEFFGYGIKKTKFMRADVINAVHQKMEELMGKPREDRLVIDKFRPAFNKYMAIKREIERS